MQGDWFSSAKLVKKIKRTKTSGSNLTEFEPLANFIKKQYHTCRNANEQKKHSNYCLLSIFLLYLQRKFLICLRRYFGIYIKYHIMNILLIIILALCGVALLVVEIFLIPGVGMAGIAGIVSMVAAVVCAYFYIGPMAGHITLGCMLVLSALSVWLFLKNRTLEKMALKTDITSKVDLVSELNVNVGDTGKSISRLAPMGKISVNGKEIEAKAVSAFIDPGTEVEITAIEGNTAIVKVKEI